MQLFCLLLPLTSYSCVQFPSRRALLCRSLLPGKPWLYCGNSKFLHRWLLPSWFCKALAAWSEGGSYWPRPCSFNSIVADEKSIVGSVVFICYKQIPLSQGLEISSLMARRFSVSHPGIFLFFLLGLVGVCQDLYLSSAWELGHYTLSTASFPILGNGFHGNSY